MIRKVIKATQASGQEQWTRPMSISLPAEPFDVPAGPDATAPTMPTIRGAAFDLKKDSVLRQAARVRQ